MESIAALGLACNVFQVISFGLDTINLVRDVYGKGSIEAPLAEYAVTLRDVAAHINAIEMPENPRKHEVQLRDNAAKCHAFARDLGEEINFLLAEKAKGDLIKTLKTVAKTTWRRRRLDRFEKQLRDIEKQMQSGLLARLCDKMDMAQTAQETLSQDVRHLLQQFQSGKTQASDLILQDGVETRQHISQEGFKLRREIVEYTKRSHSTLSSRVDRVGQASAAQVTLHLETQQSERETSERRNRFIESLSYHGMNERRNQACDSHSGTSEWIFSEIESDKQPWDNFADWLRSNEPAYWISGKPGSGKTTLTKFILDNPKTKSLLQIWRPNVILVSHFFWRPGSPMQQNIKGMLCSILRQLLQKDSSCLGAIMLATDNPESKRHDGVCGDWSPNEIEKTLMRALSHSQWPVLIVLDGLDEVHPDDGVLDLLALLQRLRSQYKVKMLLTSRPEALLSKRLGALPHLRLQDLTKRDLRRYTVDRLASCFITVEPGFTSNLEACAQFAVQLVHKAEGVFLWLALSISSVIRGIEQGDSLPQISVRVDNLPRGIHHLYEDMWHRAMQDTTGYSGMAALYFKLVLASSTANHNLNTDTVVNIMLSATEWGERILNEGPGIVDPQTLLEACKETERCLLLGCAGLLEVSRTDHAQSAGETGDYRFQLQRYFDRDRTVRFIHRSARDFLLDTVEGRDILGLEATFDIELSVRLISGSLAAARLANRFQLAAEYGNERGFTASRYRYLLWNEVDEFLEMISDVNNDSAELPPSMTAMLGSCEMLSVSGELKSEFSRRVSGASSRREFIEYCGRYLSLEAIYKLHGTDTHVEELSGILLSRCLVYLSGMPLNSESGEDFAIWRIRQTHILQEIRAALDTYGSIDVNLKGMCWGGHRFKPRFLTTTSFSILLGSIASLPTRLPSNIGRLEGQTLAQAEHQLYEHILETICVFVRRGANLSQNIFFRLAKLSEPKHLLVVNLTSYIPLHTNTSVQKMIIFYLRGDVIIQRLIDFVKRHIPILACSESVETLQSLVNVAAVKPAAPFGQVLAIYGPVRSGVVAVSHEQSARLMGVIDDVFWFRHSSADSGCKCNDIEIILWEICNDEALVGEQTINWNCHCSADCLLSKAAGVHGLPQNPQPKDFKEHCASVLTAVGVMEEVVFTDDDGQTYDFDNLPTIWPRTRTVIDAGR